MAPQLITKFADRAKEVDAREIVKADKRANPFVSLVKNTWVNKKAAYLGGRKGG